MPLSADTKLGPYEILAPIGVGGMGEVYKARDPRLSRDVAIKVSKAEFTERFTREAHMVAQLNHPNICHLYDVGPNYLVMELVEGIPLKGPLPAEKAVDYAGQILDALDAAHRKGITHRDLKPANILVTKQGIKLLDFGLAKQATGLKPDDVTMAALTTDGQITGTLQYMSPEQLQGKEVDARSDIFSFGCVLYELLSGSRAFGGTNAASVIAAIIEREPEPLKTTPPLDRVIRTCLAKDPDERFQTARDTKRNLIWAMEGELATAAPSRSRLGKVWWIVAAGALVIAAGGAVWSARSRGAAPVETLKAVQLTSYRGSEQDPSFSPDGTQIAFAWDGEKQDNFDIYVKRIGPGPPLRLTQNPSSEFAPAWSPNGSTLAFLRLSQPGKAEIVLIPPLGGPERVLTQVALPASNTTPLIHWSPDGKWLVTHDQPGAEAGGLFLISAESGERSRLTAGTTNNSDGYPVFPQDGRRLAFLRSSRNTAEMHVMDLDEALRPKRDSNLGRRVGLGGLAWTADGREIVTSIGEPGDQSLALLTPEDGKLKPLPGTQGGVQAAIAAQGGRMVFTRQMRDLDIYQVNLDASGTHASAPEPLITSTRLDRFPVYSPDGNKIAFSSLRSGTWQVWVCDSDGRNPLQVTSFEQGEVRTSAWSPDGRQIGFIWAGEDFTRRAFTVEASGGKPRKIAAMGDDLGAWRWSADGNWIYFQRLNDLWKMPAAGGTAVRLTHQGVGWAGVQSPDEKVLYYVRNGGLWSVPAERGEEREVLRGASGMSPTTMAGDAAGIYFVANATTTKPGELLFYRYTDGSVSKVTGVDAPSGYGMSLSPDGKHLLYTKFANTGSDLMLVENFR